MADRDSFTKDVYPKNRLLISEAIRQYKHFAHLSGLIEVDVTDALRIIKQYKEKTGEQLSMTAWIMRCVAKTAGEFSVIRTFRYRRNKTITFADVDIKCMIDREVDGRRIPIHYMFRQVDKKSFKEIHTQMRNVQEKLLDSDKFESKQKKSQNRLIRLPRFVRKLLWRYMITNPFKHKQNIGIVGISSLGKFTKGLNGWAIPQTMHQTQVLVCPISKKPVQKGDGFEFRDFLALTVTLNHDIVDGGPAVDFIRRLTELMEQSFELDEFAK